MRLYGSLYERLVANTRLAEPDNPQSCWLWTGHLRRGYPALAVRVEPSPAKPRTIAAHRAMLELVTGFWFPFDEAGHLCGNSECINPDHLEIQTRAHNLAERRGYAAVKSLGASWIPVLFPMAEAANDSGEYLGRRLRRIPF